MLFHLLIFLRAIRSWNFKLYHIAIERKLSFSLDNYNHAHWLWVHFYDVNLLPHTNPDVNDAFINEGNFFISRTPNVLSATGFD